MKTAPTNPAANPQNTYRFGKARFTWLTPSILRLEWCPEQQFEDRASLAVVHRELPEVPVTRREEGGTLRMESSNLEVVFNDDGEPFHAGNLQIRFHREDVAGSWQPGQTASGNLKGTTRTLDGTRGGNKVHFLNEQDVEITGPIEVGDGLLSRDGWALYEDSSNPVLDAAVPGAAYPWAQARRVEGALDWYFICCGHAYKETLTEAAQIFGTQPLPPRYAFGYWYSRYWAYTDQELLSLADDFRTMDIPIDVMVIDMDWHLPGWTGYTWDERYFPDPGDTLAALHAKGLKTALNLHPADGVAPHEDAYPVVCAKLGKDPANGETIPFDCTNPAFMETYFEDLHRPIEAQGLDFWWIDWQQGEETKIPGLDPLPWLNHTHWIDQERNPARRGRRPLNFSRFGGLGSGRYPIGFSGDTVCCWEGLAYQLWFTPTAANVLYGYWSHDIGGHFGGEFGAELYLRWVQFGLYSPILRTHTTKVVSAASERRFWAFPEPYREIMVEAVRERYQLVPYIYSECRLAYDTGLSLCRPLYYEHPEADEAYEAKGQYYFGSRIIAAPIAAPSDPETDLVAHRFWLPPGPWVERSTGKRYEGGQWHEDVFDLSECPTFARTGTLLPGQETPANLDAPAYPTLRLEIIPGGDDAYPLYEDDGHSTDYQDGGSATTRIEYTEGSDRATLTLHPTEGDYPGRAHQRPLTVVLHGRLPAAVHRGGSEHPLPYHYSESGTEPDTWHYDALRDRTLIRLGSIDHRRSETLVITGNERGENDSINGRAGLFQALERIRRMVCQSSQAHPIAPDERLPVELAQTANRLTRHPENHDAEMANLRKKLPRVPKLLQTMRDALAKKEENREDERILLLKGQKLTEAILAKYLNSK